MPSEPTEVASIQATLKGAACAPSPVSDSTCTVFFSRRTLPGGASAKTAAPVVTEGVTDLRSGPRSPSDPAARTATAPRLALVLPLSTLLTRRAILLCWRYSGVQLGVCATPGCVKRVIIGCGARICCAACCCYRIPTARPLRCRSTSASSQQVWLGEEVSHSVDSAFRMPSRGVFLVGARTAEVVGTRLAVAVGWDPAVLHAPRPALRRPAELQPDPQPGPAHHALPPVYDNKQRGSQQPHHTRSASGLAALGATCREERQIGAHPPHRPHPPGVGCRYTCPAAL